MNDEKLLKKQELEAQIAAFLETGGKIKKVPPRDGIFAVHTTHFHRGGEPSALAQACMIQNAFRSLNATRASMKKKGHGGMPYPDKLTKLQIKKLRRKDAQEA
jgi:hypothetical protein